MTLTHFLSDRAKVSTDPKFNRSGVLWLDMIDGEHAIHIVFTEDAQIVAAMRAMKEYLESHNTSADSTMSKCPFCDAGIAWTEGQEVPQVAITFLRQHLKEKHQKMSLSNIVDTALTK